MVEHYLTIPGSDAWSWYIEMEMMVLDNVD